MMENDATVLALHAKLARMLYNTQIMCFVSARNNANVSRGESLEYAFHYNIIVVDLFPCDCILLNLNPNLALTLSKWHEIYACLVTEQGGRNVKVLHSVRGC